MLAVSAPLGIDRRFGSVDSLWGLTANVRMCAPKREASVVGTYVLSQFSHTLANMSSSESEPQQQGAEAQKLSQAQKRRRRKRKVASNNKN